MLTPGGPLRYTKQFCQPGAGDGAPYSVVYSLYVNGTLSATVPSDDSGAGGLRAITCTVPDTCVHGDRLSIKASVVWNNGDPVFSEDIYTGYVDTSTPQTGDAYSRIGAGGAGLTALGDTRLGNLDAAVSTVAVSVWAVATTALSVAGSIGKFFLDNWTAARAALLDYLSATGVVSVNSRLSGTRLRLTRCVTNTIPITGLGSLSAYTKLWFTVKGDRIGADSASQLQVEKTGGCLYLRGATGTASDATLTVTDAVLGNISIKLKPAAAAKLQAMASVAWDVKGSDGTDAVTLIEGTGYIEDPVTQRLS